MTEYNADPCYQIVYDFASVSYSYSFISTANYVVIKTAETEYACKYEVQILHLHYVPMH